MFKNQKGLLSGLLLVSALFLFGLNSANHQASAETVIAPQKAKVKVSKAQNKVIVYYFYGKPRCASCQKIESWTQEAVSAINNPNVEFIMINLDKPENRHYYKDYGLYTKSVVLSKMKDGKEIKSKNLSEIWAKLGNEAKFKRYITGEIKTITEK